MFVMIFMALAAQTMAFSALRLHARLAHRKHVHLGSGSVAIESWSAHKNGIKGYVFVTGGTPENGPRQQEVWTVAEGTWDVVTNALAAGADQLSLSAAQKAFNQV